MRRRLSPWEAGEPSPEGSGEAEGRVARAYDLFSQAAALGHGTALRKLAVMNAGGMHLLADAHAGDHAVIGDQSRSLGLYHLAAAHGDTEAQLALAHRYHRGIGVQADCETAAYFYAAVADKSSEEHLRGGSEQIHEQTLLTAKAESEGTIDDGEKGEDDELIQYQVRVLSLFCFTF